MKVEDWLAAALDEPVDVSEELRAVARTWDALVTEHVFAEELWRELFWGEVRALAEHLRISGWPVLAGRMVLCWYIHDPESMEDDEAAADFLDLTLGSGERLLGDVRALL